jgi:hypothetical protein
MTKQIGQSLSTVQANTACDLWALGYSARAIARALNLSPEDARLFVIESRIPGSRLYEILRTAEESSSVERAVMQLASEGDLDAVEAYEKIRNRNRYYAVIEAIDDDEFPIDPIDT